jgi:hypothetical protein
MFIIQQLVSTASTGHPQAIVLQGESMRKISTMRNYLITRKKYSKNVRTVHIIAIAIGPKTFKNCINVDENTKYKKFMYLCNMNVMST